MFFILVDETFLYEVLAVVGKWEVLRSKQGPRSEICDLAAHSQRQIKESSQ